MSRNMLASLFVMGQVVRRPAVRIGKLKLTLRLRIDTGNLILISLISKMAATTSTSTIRMPAHS